MKGLKGVLAMFVVAIVACPLGGVALRLLWGWFMVPTFGLPVISLVQAIGIALVISFLTQQHIPRDEDEKVKMIIHELLAPVVFVSIGWVVHLFM